MDRLDEIRAVCVHRRVPLNGAVLIHRYRPPRVDTPWYVHGPWTEGEPDTTTTTGGPA